MILLNVLYESRVIKLCRVIAVGRQIAVRQKTIVRRVISVIVQEKKLIFLAFKCHCSLK